MSDIEAKSYRYLRMAIVLLLLAIGIAVGYQTSRQDFHLLGSISAYYYTPAQAIFVGGLIAVGTCMVALKGTTEFEDVVLNLGGMFAAVVAIVPTARGEDYQTLVRACQQQGGPLMTDQVSGGLDCPTVQALQDATRANVENSMLTLLIAGLVGLLLTVGFALNDRRKATPAQPRPVSQKFLWGFGFSTVLWALGGVGLFVSRTWFVDHAHFVAAAGLFACMFAVTVSNALRRDGRPLPGGSWLQRTVAAVRAGLSTLLRWPLGPYAWVAWLMIGGVAVAGGLHLGQVITLFWLEVVVALLFITFWVVQTIELLDAGTGAQTTPPVEVPPVVSGANA
jgi:hypothetical protein